MAKMMCVRVCWSQWATARVVRAFLHYEDACTTPRHATLCAACLPCRAQSSRAGWAAAARGLAIACSWRQREGGCASAWPPERQR